MTKLSLEEQQDLMDLPKSDSWRPLLQFLELLVEKQEHEVISLPLEADINQLIFAKARAEGARKLLTALKAEAKKWQHIS